jgi:hypothetical protein
MLVRPPARFVYIPPQEGILQRVTGKTAGGIVHTNKGDDLHRGSTTTQEGLGIVTLDTQQINPALEQPKLIYTSGAQPIIRWGWRRFVRTYMSASPRFRGRWFYVGIIQRQYTERARMTGVSTRQGTSYAYGRFKISPRTIPLGPWPAKQTK